MNIAFLILPLILFKLFEKVNREIAFSMILFVVAGVTISYLAIADKFDMISLLTTNQIANYNVSELENLVMLYLESYYNTILIAQVFLGIMVISLRIFSVCIWIFT